MPRAATNVIPSGAVVLALLLAAGCGDNAPKADDDGGVAPQDDAAGVDAEVDTLPPFAIDPARVYADVVWLAAPEREGRKAGTAGNRAALDYVEALFTELGLQPGGVGGTYRQSFGFEAWGLTGPPELTLAGVTGTYEDDYIVMDLSGSGSATAELAFVGHALTVPAYTQSAHPSCPLPTTGYDDFAGLDVTGKIVVALRHGPADNTAVYGFCPANAACVGTQCLWDFGYKAANARLHGAAAVILVQDYMHDDGVPLGATVGQQYYDADLPVVWATRAAVEAALPALPTWAGEITLSASSSHLTGVTATLSTSTANESLQSENLLGYVPGSDAAIGHEVVIVGGHVDHLGKDAADGTIYPGADDDASGTAVMMELARAAVRGADPPARTLLFAAWNAEEEGLLGSCAYVDQPPLFPLADTKAMFSLDMVGSGDGSGILLYGGAQASDVWLSSVIAGATADAGLAYTVTNTDPIDASDHWCFSQAGVSALMVLTGPDLAHHAWYHTPEDTADKVTPADLEAVARTMWAGLQVLGRGGEGSYSLRSAPRSVAAPGPRAPRPRY
jgi:hypothetical protein